MRTDEILDIDERVAFGIAAAAEARRQADIDARQRGRICRRVGARAAIKRVCAAKAGKDVVAAVADDDVVASVAGAASGHPFPSGSGSRHWRPAM